MRVVIAGGSGFLGRALAASLARDGHRIQILTRRRQRQAPPLPQPHADASSPAAPPPVEYITWQADGSVGPWAGPCRGADTIVNLAGESIGSRRWSLARKDALVQSRLLATRSLVRFIRQSSPPPSAFLSASAIGLYGDRGSDILAEDAEPGSGFLASLAAAWEREARDADGGPTRVVLLRTGIVLDPRSGALARMLLPYRVCAGGPLGPGRQFMSWIHRDDWVSLARWAIRTPEVRGPLNLTAPHAVTNATFARALRRVLRRPSLVRVPAFALKLLLGEMAGPLLFYSQRVVPRKALDGGFTFAHPEVEGALAHLLDSKAAPAA
ncbi:MAG TPA: TIGR01777 family oxidoreductase [Vicinamibacterales bacterium]|nr:TIGR01777 family oxidoreductase [Vicinamibacterales bacterium]HPW20684.1 TIGR01777 family oxidoreductase [Vicinamibacterales bacterium]